MDKLKAFLAVLKKQHFWVMCGVVLILGLSGWAWATSNLAGQYRANRTKIEGIYKDLDQLRSSDRENPESIKGAEIETGKLRIKVKGAWEDVYAEQRDKVLRWPKVLGEDFLRIVPQLPPSEEIPVDQRERYWNYAREEFPRLLEIIDARHYADKSDDVVSGLDQRGGRGGKGGPPGGKARPKDDPDAPRRTITRSIGTRTSSRPSRIGCSGATRPQPRKFDKRRKTCGSIRPCLRSSSISMNVPTATTTPRSKRSWPC